MHYLFVIEMHFWLAILSDASIVASLELQELCFVLYIYIYSYQVANHFSLKNTWMGQTIFVKLQQK